MEKILTHTEASGQSGMSVTLEPPFTEYNSSFNLFLPDYQLETNLFDDKECQINLGEFPVHDYLLDQEVTFQVSPDLPLCSRVPYKEMPNFGVSRIGQSWPLLSIAEVMRCDKVGANHTDSPPLVSPKRSYYQPEGSSSARSILSCLLKQAHQHSSRQTPVRGR